MGGVALAWAGISELRHIAPANLPRLDSITLDPAAMAFAAFSALAAAILFGIAPAWRAARPDVAPILRASGRTAGLGASGWLRNGVVVAEVALSFVLLIGSGLMIRSFIALQHIETGIQSPQTVDLPFTRRPSNPRFPQEREILIALQNVPGVQSATAATPFPLTGGYGPIRWGLEPALSDPSKFQAADIQVVLPDYFAVSAPPIVAGRTFTKCRQCARAESGWSSTRCWRRRLSRVNPRSANESSCVSRRRSQSGSR